MKEIWKVIEGCPESEVSSLGRVRRNGKICKLCPDKEGYLRCTVKTNGGMQRVHRLVAMTFLPNPLNLPLVDHIDQNKQNNQVNNLRWVSYQENAKNANQSKPKRKEPIIGINTTTGEIIEFASQKEAHDYLNIRPGSGEVNKALRGTRKVTHGFKFYYKSDYLEQIN